MDIYSDDEELIQMDDSDDENMQNANAHVPQRQGRNRRPPRHLNDYVT